MRCPLSVLSSRLNKPSDLSCHLYSFLSRAFATLRTSFSHFPVALYPSLSDWEWRLSSPGQCRMWGLPSHLPLAQKSAYFSFLLSGSRVPKGGERAKPILVALLCVGRELGLSLCQLCRCVLVLGNDELAPWASWLGWTPYPACALRWGTVPRHWRTEHWCQGAKHQLLRNAGCFLQHS